MANLTTCVICGERYNYCPNCSVTHSWKFYTDTREHYQIYMILEELNCKACNAEEAKIRLNNIGVTSDTDLSNLKPNVAEQICKILNYVDSKSAKKKSNDKN